MGKNNEHQIDIETLLAIAKTMKAMGKINKIDMESKSFIDMLKKEARKAGIGLLDGFEVTTKAVFDEMDAWGKAFKDSMLF